MAIDYASLGGIIKKVYDKNFITNHIIEESFLYDKISVAGDKPAGEGYYFAGRFARNQGGGAQNEKEALRQSGAPLVKQAYILPKVFTWTGQLTGLAAAMAKGEPGSFANIMDDSFTDALAAARQDLDRQFYGIGDGKVGTASATPATSATQTVDNPLNFMPGAYYDQYAAAGTLTASGLLVSDIDPFAMTVTFSASVTGAASDYYVKQGMKINAPTDGKEMMGIRGIIDDGSKVDLFEGLYRASSTYYKLWRGLVIAAGSVDLTADILRRASDRLQVMGCKNPLILSNYGQRRKYLALVQPQRRFMDAKFDAGYSIMEWDGRPWFVSARCPKGAVYQPNFSNIQKFEVLPLQLDTTGGTLKPLTGYDVAYFYYKQYANLGSKQPNQAGIVIEGLNEPTYY